jgi:diketogulonate reductase-like aldo/keto reductase
VRVGATLKSAGRTARAYDHEWLLAENAAMFDFSLSDDEMAEISALARTGRRLIPAGFGRPDWD